MQPITLCEIQVFIQLSHLADLEKYCHCVFRAYGKAQ